jgi:hypothetical protein
VEVASEGSGIQLTFDSCLFESFAAGRFARSYILIDVTFRYHPSAAATRGDEQHFHIPISNSMSDDAGVAQLLIGIFLFLAHYCRRTTAVRTLPSRSFG